MDILSFLSDNIVILDGGFGTLLQSRGLPAGHSPCSWNIENPDAVILAHKEYFDAGSNIVCTNTFGVNKLNYSDEDIEKITISAVENAKKARELSIGDQPKFVALDISPCGKLLKPYGELDFEDAVKLFSYVIKIGAKQNVDLIFIETMSDSYETKAALLAAKESCNLPIFVSNSYGHDGKLMTGASPEAMSAMLEAMNCYAVGMNCSLGSKQLMPVLKKYAESTSLPIIFKPNAGLPSVENGKTVFSESPEEFAENVKQAALCGARLIGGCCGTTPDHIREAVKALSGIKPFVSNIDRKTVVTSYTHAVSFGESPVIIGERINPTGKKRLKQALIDGNIDYLLGEAVNQQECGAMILDVNVGLPQIDEKSVLKNVITEVQAVSDLPLQIDTSDPVAMEAALRVYNGKAMINSVNGKEESMNTVFPLVKKYGGVVVALTLDESGIPDTANGRLEIAEKIISRAAEFGINKNDIVIDPLCMTVSASANVGNVVLTALKIIREKLGVHTVLGVSNVSFGLPCREVLNSTFLALAFQCGLSSAIMNPGSTDMMRTYHAFRTLRGIDQNCSDYIKYATSHESELRHDTAVSDIKAAVSVRDEKSNHSPLYDAVVHGRKEAAEILSKSLISDGIEPLSIVQTEIIPALNEVGKGFEAKRIYLPQLLMSAEAAKSAFEPIRETSEKCGNGTKRFPVVLATVKGDIHDIGKNIVHLLLENYGFEVIDLGRDVPPEDICNAVKEHNAPLAGLSALMTTTVPSMEETILLLHKEAPFCKIVVGGAVLNEEYASKIGADAYSADAMETVRYAETLIK